MNEDAEAARDDAERSGSGTDDDEARERQETADEESFWEDEDADTVADVAGSADGETDAASGETDADDGHDATADAPEGVERVVDEAADHDEELADSVARLGDRIAELESELAAKEERVSELENKLKRSQADFQNYKKRAKKREAQIKERATEDFVERVVSVRDNLVRALEQDEDADIRPGVESTLGEFDRVLGDEGVETIDPDAGDDVDPHRHEVMLRVDADQPSGTVVDVYRPGYEMGEKVIRAAQVTVSSDEDDS